MGPFRIALRRFAGHRWRLACQWRRLHHWCHFVAADLFIERFGCRRWFYAYFVL